MVNEVEVEDPNAEPDKKYVYTIEHEVNVVNLSQSGCGVNKIKERKTARDWDPRTHEQTARDWDPRTQEQTAREWDPRTQEQTAREWDPRTHESLVMVDSGASVNVCPKWFGNSKLEQSDDATCLRGANGKPLQEYGKRQIWLKICGRSHQSNGGVENYQKQLQGQVRTMLAAMQEHTHYRPSADNALMRWIVRHAAWLIPRFRGSEIHSPFYRAMGGPYRGKLVEFGETVLAHLPEVGKGSGNPAPKLADRWKSGVWLGKSDLTDEHLVRTDDGVVYVRSVRRLAENSWSEENLKAVVETLQKPRSMTTDDASDPRVVPEAHEQESPNEETNENDDESGETPDKPDDEDHEMEGETLPEPDIAAMSSSSRGEKRTETQENVFVKRRLMAKSPKRPITLVPPPEDPVKRRLIKKTDMRNDEMVVNVDEHLMNVVSMLTKDENMPEANSNEDNEMPKLTILDDYEEMMKGRQKELNSLKEMGTMTVVKRSEAVGKRTIQTR